MEHYLNEEHILLFLLQLFVLLTVAKLLGGLCRRWGYPALAGEVVTGILLGPTLFGRALPGLHQALFPDIAVQTTMLETVSWFGVLFLLLATGFEINISTVWKQGKASVTIGTVGVFIPIIMGCVVFWWLPQDLWGQNATRLTFTLFVSIAAAISAIPVIAKILHDLEILKSDLGLTTLSAFVVNDVLGWLLFTFVIGFAGRGGGGVGAAALVFLGIMTFGTLCLTVGSGVVGRITRWLKTSSLPYPASVLTFISCLGMLSGAIAQWIGIHAILGFFLAGIMAGNTKEISERTRGTMSQMIHAIFVPVFFASIGLKIDFLNNLSISVVAVFTAVAIVGKFVGAWAGGLFARFSRADSFSLGIAHIPGGAMEIIVGMLALELGLVSKSMFVAIVFAALFSSVLVGPLLAWSIRRRGALDVARFLMREACIADLAASTRRDAIEELCRTVAENSSAVGADELISAVRAREEIMGTGLGSGIAVPHARLKDLDTPIIAFGRSKTGMDWDAPDGVPARCIFMILTPEEEEGMQVQILAALARCALRKDVHDRIDASEDGEELYRALTEALRAEAVSSS